MKIRVFAMVAGLLWARAGLAAEVPALLQWSQRVELALPVSGVVKEVGVEAGQRVRKGAPLVVLDNQAYQARVAESRAVLARHREEAAEAKRDLDRVQELYDRTIIATTELDQARLRHARAQALVEEADARLRVSSKNLEDTVLRAPFDGVVVARQAEPGQAVASGLQPQTLVVLARAGEMVARARLTESQISKLKAGQAVTVEAGGQSYAGRVKTIGLEPVAAKEGTVYPVDIVFPVKELLRAGMAAVVKLP